jgi:glycosyltransferase involved in cell wall biosynthesis
MNKNVLIVVHHLGIGGGAERIAAGLASGLKDQEYNVTLLTFYNSDQAYEYKGNLVCLDEKISMSPLVQATKAIKRAKAIHQLCKKKEIDTVIAFLSTSNIPAILSKLLFLNRSKIVVSERNNPLYLPPLNRTLIKALYRKADLVVSVSKYVELILNTLLKIEKTKTIYNFKDINDILEKSAKPILIEHEPLFNAGVVFMTIGRLSKQKNHAALIRSFAKVVEKEGEAKLIIIGSGENEKRLRELIQQLDLDKNVFLLGQINNVYSYIKRADVFVLSSDYEGFPNVALEAMVLGKPIISTDCVSGPRELMCPELTIEQKISYPYYGEYGILVEPLFDESDKSGWGARTLTEKENSLADVLIDAINNRDRLKGYKNGFRRAKMFDKDVIIKEWESVI